MCECVHQCKCMGSQGWYLFLPLFSTLLLERWCLTRLRWPARPGKSSCLCLPALGLLICLISCIGARDPDLCVFIESTSPSETSQSQCLFPYSICPFLFDWFKITFLNGLDVFYFFLFSFCIVDSKYWFAVIFQRVITSLNRILSYRGLLEVWNMKWEMVVQEGT